MGNQRHRTHRRPAAPFQVLKRASVMALLQPTHSFGPKISFIHPFVGLFVGSFCCSRLSTPVAESSREWTGWDSPQQRHGTATALQRPPEPQPRPSALAIRPGRPSGRSSFLSWLSWGERHPHALAMAPDETQCGAGAVYPGGGGGSGWRSTVPTPGPSPETAHWARMVACQRTHTCAGQLCTAFLRKTSDFSSSELRRFRGWLNHRKAHRKAHHPHYIETPVLRCSTCPHLRRCRWDGNCL